MDQSLGLQPARRHRAVERVSQFVAGSIDAARACDAPFHDLVLDQVFPDDVYAAMLTAMPEVSDYRPMSGRSKALDTADGTHTRVKLDLFPEYIRHLPPEKRGIWDIVGSALCSEPVKAAFVRRLAEPLQHRFGSDYARTGFYPVPILTRDIPGYSILPHPDTRWNFLLNEVRSTARQ